jgi:SAM dependent carboxyl methyltransferase
VTAGRHPSSAAHSPGSDRSTEGMKAGGYYDDHSEYQRKVAASGDELIRNAVARIALPAIGATCVIADYGCSTGRNSILSLRTAVDAVREREATRPIAALHNDVPTNDWNTLFANLASDPASYLHADGPPVLPLASAGSFFEPAAPARSVQLGVSFSAAHWLRTQPTVTVPEGFYFCEATNSARAALAAQAEADWTTFLAARAADLAPSARLIVQMVGTDDGAQPPNVTARALLQAMAEVAEEMASDGVLATSAVTRYLLPVYARTPGEARAPIEHDRDGLASQFGIEIARVDPVANPYLDRLHTDHDVEAYGKSYAAFVRGFTESSLREHLFEPGTRSGTPDAAIDDFFGRLEQRFAADPEADAFADWTLTVVLART